MDLDSVLGDFQGLALPEKEQNILKSYSLFFFFLSMLHWNKKISRIGFKSQETDSGCGKCYKKGDFKLFENQMTINDKRKMSLTVQRKKVGLKLNIQKTKIMASSPITSWQIDGKTTKQ